MSENTNHRASKTTTITPIVLTIAINHPFRKPIVSLLLCNPL